MLFCKSCDQYLNSRQFTVDAIIIKKGEILLIKRKGYPFAGYWALPGGYVDKDETAEEAMVRETREETGLIVISFEFLGLYSEPKRHPKQLIAGCFTVKTKGSPQAGDDAGDLRFFPLVSLPENIAFDHRKMIDDYRKKYVK